MFSILYSFFFFNDPATTEIYTLSLHDALPIFCDHGAGRTADQERRKKVAERENKRKRRAGEQAGHGERSEEHTSELQSRSDLVCRLLLEKKKKKKHKKKQK